MFIAVGPPAFTGLALIGMANAAIKVFPHTFVIGATDIPTAQVLKTVAVFSAMALWTLSLFFFCISLLATLCGLRQIKFHLVSDYKFHQNQADLLFGRLGGHSFFQTQASSSR